MSPAIKRMRDVLIEECQEKEGFDPRETDLRGDHHATITITVDEIRAFLIATAEKVSDAQAPRKRKKK